MKQKANNSAPENEVATAPNLAVPIVNSPIQGGRYYSPVPVNVKRGVGGLYFPQWFTINFHELGIGEKKESDPAVFTQALPPGPHRIETRAGRHVGGGGGGGDQHSEWGHVGWFYVRTPPE
ncbi:hypothetical protein ACYZUD_30205 [Pseudomonas sp. XS1P51]